jgi:TolB protein
MVNVSTKKMTKISQENLGPDLHMVPWQISPPNWSSDGKWIVYATAKGDEGYWDIYKYAVDKGETVQITHSEAGDLEPVWSPDGKHIAFIRYLPEKCENDCDVELFVMNSDGSGEIRLTDHPGVDAYPVWSPDSKRIAFLSQREDNLDIYVINWDGSGLKRLTDDPADDYDHNWSPDGKEIVFVSERDGNAEIYKVNVDGGAAVNLTQDTADDRSPVWSAGIPTR